MGADIQATVIIWMTRRDDGKWVIYDIAEEAAEAYTSDDKPLPRSVALEAVEALRNALQGSDIYKTPSP